MLSSRFFFWMIKINNFRGDLTDISAKKEALTKSAKQPIYRDDSMSV